jgi:hypothetical protein
VSIWPGVVCGALLNNMRCAAPWSSCRAEAARLRAILSGRGSGPYAICRPNDTGPATSAQNRAGGSPTCSGEDRGVQVSLLRGAVYRRIRDPSLISQSSGFEAPAVLDAASPKRARGKIAPDLRLVTERRSPIDLPRPGPRLRAAASSALTAGTAEVDESLARLGTRRSAVWTSRSACPLSARRATAA